MVWMMTSLRDVVVALGVLVMLVVAGLLLLTLVRSIIELAYGIYT